MSPKMSPKMNAKTNAKTNAHAHPFSPKIGGDTEGVENITTYTNFHKPIHNL